MRFWDSSALVPLLIAEPASASIRRVLAEDTSIAVWWGTSVECVGAIAHAQREGRIGPDAVESAHGGLARLRTDWVEVDATSPVRVVAERLSRTHPLRTGDALQLSAAIAAAEGSPSSLLFATLDDRLADAAMREGFSVIRFDRS